MPPITLPSESNTQTRYCVLLLHGGGPKDLTYTSLWQYMNTQLSSRRTMDLLPQCVWQAILYTSVLPWSVRRERSIHKSKWVSSPTAKASATDGNDVHEEEAVEPAVDTNSSDPFGSSSSAFYCSLLAKKVEDSVRQKVHCKIAKEAETEKIEVQHIDRLVSVDVKFASVFQPGAVEEVLQQFHLLGNYAGIDDTDGNGCIVREEKLIVLPLYPQYSSLFTGIAWDAFRTSSYFTHNRSVPHLQFVRSFSTNSLYLRALELHIRRFIKANGVPNHLFVAFAGIPKRFIFSGDCYQMECLRTFEILSDILASPLATDVSEKLESSLLHVEAVDPSVLYHCFLPYGVESGIGPRIEWLAKQLAKEADGSGSSPTTTTPVVETAPEPVEAVKAPMERNLGVAHLVTPGMIIDDVKQIHSITGRVAKYLLKLGWDKVELVPCMNESTDQVNYLAEMINDYITE